MLKKMIRKMVLTFCITAMVSGIAVSVEAKPKKLSKKTEIGDTVYFGKYEQDGKQGNGKEKIEWNVLDKKGNQVLLISKKVLDIGSYNKKYEYIIWKNCTLRKWLNVNFMNTAFTTEEKKKIINTKLRNEDNEEYKTKGGSVTKDKLFLLSLDEADMYFDDEEDRATKMTAYTKAKILKAYGETNSKVKEYSEEGEYEEQGWWLRSPGYLQNYAAYVYIDGEVHPHGYNVYMDIFGIRPAMWVNCGSKKSVKK